MSAEHTARVMPGPGAPLEVVRRPVPAPGPGEALVRVGAVSLNYHDLVNLLGLLDGPWPRVPMTDGAGVVVAVGPGVTGVAVGDRVFGAFHPEWLDGPPVGGAKRVTPGDSGDGWLQEHVVYPAQALLPSPAHLDDAEAATLPCAGSTAWSCLELAAIGPDDVVVTQGTGGVSLFVAQLAIARGARVLLVSSAAKLAAVSHLGAEGIDREATPDWAREVRRLTDGRGADLVVDLGGATTLGRSVMAARPCGHVAVVGVLSGFGDAEISVATVMTRNLVVAGITVGSVADHRALAAAVGAAGLRPQISHRLGWREVVEAVRVVQAQEHLGKVVLEIGRESVSG